MTTPKQINQEINKYLSLLSVDEEEQLLDKIGELLWQRVAVRVSSYIAPDKQDKLLSLIDTEEVDTKALVAFLAADIANLADIVGEEAYHLREEYYAIMQATQ